MKTLLLDQTTWDLTLDANNNIALAAEPYAFAQDAASAIRLFQGELWYDATRGVPYFESVLGQYPSSAYLKSVFEAAALTVPGVAEARCTALALVDRKLTGTVELIDIYGQANNVSF